MANSNIPAVEIGKPYKANNGQIMTVIAYKNNQDVDVQFNDEQQTIVRHVIAACIKAGSVANPNFDRFKRSDKLHEKAFSKRYNCYIEIIDSSKGYEHLTVQFEDDGTIRDNVMYNHFRNGKVAKVADDVKHRSSITIPHTEIIHGMHVDVIEIHRGRNGTVDLLVRETGEILYGKQISHYKNHQIKLTNDEMIRESTNLKGLHAKIIDDSKGRNALTIQFDDGEILYNIMYGVFKSGEFAHPNWKEQHTEQRRQKYSAMNPKNRYGLAMKFVDFADNNMALIEYETGLQVKTRPERFANGNVGHKLPYTIGNVVMDKFAYVYNDEGNFYCHCNKCGYKNIMNVTEMKVHKCVMIGDD